MHNQRGRRVARLAVIAGLLSPVTGAGILLALAHTKFRTHLPLDVATIGTFAYFWLLVVYSVLVAALPAALFAGMGASLLVTLPARGVSPRALLPLGAVLGAGCGLFVVGVFGGVPLQNPYAVAGALNGALWGLLVARDASKNQRGVTARGSSTANMASEKRPLTRGDAALIAAVAIGVLILFVALIQWESSRECVRWSTRIDIDDPGNVRSTRICAERQPRQPGQEPPFDPRSPKDK